MRGQSIRSEVGASSAGYIGAIGTGVLLLPMYPPFVSGNPVDGTAQLVTAMLGGGLSTVLVLRLRPVVSG